MLNPKTVILIENYRDQWGNNGYTNIVFKAKQHNKRKNVWKILEPTQAAKKWSTIPKREVTVIHPSVACVGYYTSHSYYIILKSLGLTGKLNDESRAWHEASIRDTFKNTVSWHSNGFQIKKEMNTSQKLLF